MEIQDFSFHSSGSDGILYTFVLSLIKGNLLIGKIITFVSLLGSGFLMNELFKIYSIMPRRNYTLMLVWMILVIAFPMLWSISPQLLAFTVVIYASFLLFRAAIEDLQIRDLITISFLFSIASLIYKPFLGYVLFLPLALMILRQFNLRYFLIILIIYAIPYFYLWVFFFFFGESGYIAGLFDFDVFYPVLNTELLSDYHFTIPLLTGGLLFIYSLIQTIGNLAKKLIHIRIILSLLIAYFLFTVLLISISPSDFGYNIYLLIVPVSGIMAVGLSEIKASWILDIYLLFYIVTSVLLIFF